MSELSSSLRDEARNAIDSPRCACGALKSIGRAFCLDCFFSLPGWMKSGLSKLFSEGLAEAWDEARDFLTYEVERIR